MFSYMNDTIDICFLDLEGTMIESWDFPALINVDVIKLILSEKNIRKFGVFSFAIWSDVDRIHFMNSLCHHIENALDIVFDPTLIPTKREMLQAIKDNGKDTFLAKRSISFDDFNELWSKDRAFVDWIRATSTLTLPNTKIILLDDIVSDCQLKFGDVEIEMIKIHPQ